jgi:hypothetical protein
MALHTVLLERIPEVAEAIARWNLPPVFPTAVVEPSQPLDVQSQSSYPPDPPPEKELA